MSACGGGGNSGTSSTSTTKTGALVDSAVSNIHYQTATQSGTTNASGEFTYKKGETVTFSIGDLKFPAVSAGAVVTPVSMAGATSITDQRASNIARLLQSLDQDGNPNNGISIPDGAAAAAASVNFNVDASTFGADAAVTNLVANSGSSTTSLISAADAEAHVTTTLDGLSTGIVGVWKITNGAAFKYLVLLKDHTFLYAENDLTVKEPQNGLEAGTYSYDASTGNITFKLSYDDNAPGTDSGVGDIGTPVVLDAVPSAGNTILTSTDVGLSFNAVNFSSSASSPIVGAWEVKNTSTGEFEFLLLMPDGTFLYAENDPTVSSPQNGLEVGTYTYDSSTSKATFNISYDDNAPGTNSGIGDIGTPSIIDGVLSNSNNTLTAKSGRIVFTRAL